MNQEQPPPKPRRSKLKITLDRVVACIRRVMQSDGLEVAKAEFRHLNELFSTEQGWGETAETVYALFAEEQRQLAEAARSARQEEQAARLEEQRAAAPSYYLFNTNKAAGMTHPNFHSDQMVGFAEDGSEIIHTNQNDGDKH